MRVGGKLMMIEKLKDLSTCLNFAEKVDDAPTAYNVANELYLMKVKINELIDGVNENTQDHQDAKKCNREMQEIQRDIIFKLNVVETVASNMKQKTEGKVKCCRGRH